MSKSIDCKNCKDMYDCERTYLGGCTDGKEWEDKPVGVEEQLKKIGYKSPITILREKTELDLESAILKAVEKVNIEVDREELIKALRYDRNQYDKGYSDGYAVASKEIVEKLAGRLKALFPIKEDIFSFTTSENIHKAVDEICKEITEGKV